MATDCHTLAVISCTLLVMLLGGRSGEAQESPATFEAILDRLDQLERDNDHLRKLISTSDHLHLTHTTCESSANRPPDSRLSAAPNASGSLIYRAVDTQTLFASSERSPLPAEGDISSIVSEAVNERTLSEPAAPQASPADALQDRRLSDLDRALKKFQTKATTKTYPNVTVNGVFQADAGWIHQDAVSETLYGPIQDGSDFRRTRLSAKGGVTETTNYFFQMDFGFFGRPTFTDVWLEQTQVPIFGNVRIGQWKQPFGLETVSSFRYTTFMERSLLFQPFTPFRHLGIGFYNSADDLSATWAASVFRTGQDQFGGTLSSSGGYGTSERLTWNPAWDNAGKNYVHLGFGHFFNAPPGQSVNFRTIPEFFVGANGPGAVGTSGQVVPGGSNGTPFFVATGNLDVPYYNVLGSELLWVDGPVSLQSEAMVSLVSHAGSTAVLPGAYAQAGYFLTGEHRPYDRKYGTIDRVIPKSNLGHDGKTCRSGCGAWEVAGRWSYLDLNDAAIRGGTIMDYTAGINWYWNPWTKMVLNYVHAISDSATSLEARTDMFGVRAQIDF
jgi:phosphate-selective porin OprO/OprP